MSGVVRALTSSHISPFVMLRGNDESGLVDLWAADDPLVIAHPEWFTEELESVARRSSPKVESATEEPKVGSSRSGRKVETATAEPALSTK